MSEAKEEGVTKVKVRGGPGTAAVRRVPSRGTTTRVRGRVPLTVPAEVCDAVMASGGWAELRRSVPTPSAASEASRVFDAISDPARLRILCALEWAPLCPCLLREIEPRANSAISYHLRVLKEAGLVATAARSNYRIYEPTALGRRLLSFVRKDPSLGPRLRAFRG